MNHRLWQGVLVFGVLGSAGCAGQPVALTAPQYIPMKDFVIQSHRGAGKLLPENTMLAFDYGWKHGVVPEADLRTTRDGVIVAFHDNNFKRLVKDAPPQLADKGIEDLDYAQVAELDVGSWMGDAYAGLHVPRVRELFAAMSTHPQRRLYLDIKNVDLTVLAAMVNQYGLASRVILASKYHDLHAQWKKLLPQSNTLQWIGGTPEQIARTVQDLRDIDFADLTMLQVHVHYNVQAADPFTPSSQFIRDLADELRGKGIIFQVLPWDVHEPEVYEKLLDLGVASFATDYVQATVDAVKRYYQEHESSVP